MASSHTLRWAIAVVIVAVAFSQIAKQAECDKTPVDVLFLVDITTDNNTVFERQQKKLVETIRHLNDTAGSRDPRYGIIVFHRRPLVLVSLVSPRAKIPERTISEIEKLRPRRNLETSPARALDLAASQLDLNGREDAKKLIVVAHNGFSTDLIAETIDSRNLIDELEGHVFVVTGVSNPNIGALIGYANDRSRVYHDDNDRTGFMNEISKAIGATCPRPEKPKKENKGSLALGVRAQPIAEEAMKPKLDQCKSNKVDLMIVLDTSGSVYNAFAEERQFAKDLISSIDTSAFEDGRLQVSTVRFSSTPAVAIPFTKDRPKDEIIEKIGQIAFTGMNTRIADAVDLAIAELKRSRRKDATQIFILISDGHGQEFWSVVQATGKKLQSLNAEVFSVTTSRDYNFAELLLYAGDEKRVFIGPKHAGFIPTISPLINRCLEAGSSPVLQPTKIPLPNVSPLNAPKSEDRKTELPEEKEQLLALRKPSTAEEKREPSKPKSTEHRLESSESNSIGRKPADPIRPTSTERKLEASTLNSPEAKPAPEKSNNAENLQLKQHLERKDNQSTIEDMTEKGTFSEKHQAEKESQSVPENLGEPKVLQVQPAQKAEETLAIIRPLADENEHPKSIIEPPLSSPTKDGRCEVDLVFIIDRSMSVEAEFQRQLKFATELLQKLRNEDFTERRIRVAAISFAREAGIEFEFGRHVNKDNIINKLLAIQHTGGETSAVSGVSLAIKFAQSSRRPNANLMLILISDGNSQDPWRHVVEQASVLRTLPNTAFYAVTFSAKYSFEELREFAGDKWRVFVDARSRKFIDDAAHELNGCPGNGVREDSSKQANEDLSVQNIQQASACNDAIDLILVLDKSTSMVDDFDSAKNFAEELVESAPAGDYVSRIRVALVTFNDKAHLDFGLKKFTSRDDILFALERAENSGGETSAVSGLNVATGEIKANRRNASRLIVVLLSDGGSKDAWELVNATAKRLHDTDAEVFGVTMTDRYFREELLVFTGNPGHLFVRMKGREQEFAASVDLKKCGGNGELKHDNIIDRADSEGRGPTRLPKPTLGDSNEIADIKRKPDAGVEKLPVIKDISTETSAPERSIANSTRVPISIDSNCRVDLMFIIDRSESVEREFQKQLQFAVDLVKRMSSADFGSRVRVAAVSFYSKAQLEFPFGKFKEQSKILDALLQIEHVGGSTSAVSGVNLAVDEIQKTGRNDARRMIVLISDGNSQDMWDKVLEAAGRLREIDADVYAVTVSHDYYFRELELYAGNKWLVYIDARIRQFLDEAEKSVAQCRGPLIAASTPPREKPNTTPLPHRADLKETTVPERATDDVTFASPEESQSCRQDPVDVVIILDTSTSVEKDFYAEKQFALDLVKVFPEEHFVERISVALVQFAGSAKLQFGFGEQKTRGDVLYEMERVEHTGGQTSLVSGANEAIKQIKANHRPNARLVTVFVTDGNSQDLWHIVQETAKKLRETGGEVYAVTLSPKYYFDELKEYAGSEDHVYIDDRIHKFIKEVGASVVTCAGEKQAKVTLPPTEEVRITSPTVATSGPLVTKSSEKSVEKSNEKVDEKRKGTPKDAVIQSFDKSDFAKDDTPVVATRELQSPKTINKKCKYSKMDLQIILDASTSRQEVFEHQRELALSLIERLPIDAEDTHVAVGVNSFTAVPTLRQTLGLGRDKQMVRHAIEDIKYNGGSTLTAEAVELSVQDLERGRRPDAVQVVVLMNDGMSQDLWEDVLKASERLRATGAERFGVALGENVDLRELMHYIGDKKRIYRDGSTERFLSDVVSLITGGEDCEVASTPKALVESSDACNLTNVDIMVVFDNSDGTSNLTDPSVNSNRYLLLDVLGSLPATPDGKKIKLSIISFADKPNLLVGFNDNQQRESVFRKVEEIEAEHGKPAYAKAINFALEEYERSHRSDARGILLIVGDGKSDDSASERNIVAQDLRKQKSLSCFAVDSGKAIDEESLAQYTGSADRVFNYDRNAEFAKELLSEAAGPNCVQEERLNSRSAEKSAEKPSSSQRDLLRDIASKLDNGLKGFEGEKVVIKEKVTATSKKITPRPTITSRRPTARKSSSVPPTTKPSKTTRVTKKAINATTLSSAIATSTTAKRTTTARATTRRTTSTITPRTTRTITTPRTTRTTRARPTTPSRVPTSTRKPVTRTTRSTTTEPITQFAPGCLLDVMIIIDSSGSVEDTFLREKELAAGIIERLRVGSNNARIALIKFAAKEKVKTVWSFDRPQSRARVLRALQSITFSSGTTAIHTALLQAITEYTAVKGARPGEATPVGIVFTDGFGQKDTTEAASLLRKVVPNMFAVAINHQFPISRPELERIAGSKERVFTDSNIDELYSMLQRFTSKC